jgi:hypothetical protein
MQFLRLAAGSGKDVEGKTNQNSKEKEFFRVNRWLENAMTLEMCANTCAWITRLPRRL